jgi:GMP synthase (glutamine-hydrolysing)
MHDQVLIIDFGSQVTQLIARRVREMGFIRKSFLSRARGGLCPDEAQGGSFWRPGIASREGSPRAPQACSRRAFRSWHSQADAAGAQLAVRWKGITGSSVGRKLVKAPSRLFEGVWSDGATYGVDEPWRPHYAIAAGLCG